MCSQFISVSDVQQRQIGSLHQRVLELCLQAPRKATIHISSRPQQQAAQHQKMFPARRSLIGASDHCCYPVLCRHAASNWHLARQRRLCRAFPDVPLVLENGEGGGVEEAHDALTSAQAVGTFPYCRCRKKLRDKELYVQRVREGGEERCGGPEQSDSCVSAVRQVDGGGGAGGIAQYLGVSCWSVHVWSDRSRVSSSRSAGMMDDGSVGDGTGEQARTTASSRTRASAASRGMWHGAFAG